MHTVIDQAVQVRLIATTFGPHAVPAVLHYQPADPLAVRMFFPPEISLDGAAVDWAFARNCSTRGFGDRPGGVMCGCGRPARTAR